MFRTILTPLDASSLAEQALPYALSIARRSEARIDLVQVHVLGVPQEHVVARYVYEPEMEARQQQKEQLYLDATARLLEAVSPVRITTAVLHGMDAEGILRRIQDTRADLVVMASHGRGPVGRFFLGSMADEIIRHGTAPVLLAPAQERPASLIPEPELEHILVPLDGSSRAERVLPAALDLVRAWEGRCTLLRVVEPGTPPAAGGPPALDREQHTARAYLLKIARRLQEEGVSVQARVVVGSPVARVILEEAQRLGAHGIALATHGHGGMTRLLLGSVADQLARAASLPTLVYRSVEDS